MRNQKKSISLLFAILFNLVLNAQCHMDDFNALKSFYECVSLEERWGWGILNNVTPPANCNLTNLQGISIDENGRVCKIEFNKGPGSVSCLVPELSNLSYLTVLDLRDNPLTGNIPTELGDLRNLKYLNLRNSPGDVYSGLRGIIPNSLGNLNKLEHIDFSNHFLSGEIPPELGKLTNLKILYLHQNQFTGSIPSELGNLIRLEALSLKSKALCYDDYYNYYYHSPKMMGVIPNEFGNLVNLNYLDLTCNNFTGTIPPQIGNLTKLESLQLGNNKLSGSIPTELGNLINLKRLNLAGNRLNGPIPAEIGYLNRLWETYLSGNYLSGCYDKNLSSLCYIPFYTVEKRVFIDEGNNFDETWANFCKYGYGSCDSLAKPNCNLSDWKALKTLFENTDGSNWKSSQGWNIHLNNNEPLDSCNLGKLFGITLDQNGRVSNINLPNNNLTGEIPSNLHKLNYLKSLTLQKNKLSGALPTTLIYIYGLNKLNLINNQLSGCYNDSLKILCNQLLVNEHTHVSFGNNLNASWQNFCACSAGICNGYDVGILSTLWGGCIPFNGKIETLGEVEIKPSSEPYCIKANSILLNAGFSIPKWIDFEASIEICDQ